MKHFKMAAQTIEGATWLLLHLVAHLLLILGAVVTLLDLGIKGALTYIKSVQAGLVAGLGVK